MTLAGDARFLWENLLLGPRASSIARRERPVDYLFVVYPGVEEHVAAFVSPRLHRMFEKYFPLSLAVLGRITPGIIGKRGLVLGIPGNPANLSRQQLRTLLLKLERFGRVAGAKAIALGGTLPGRLVSNNIPILPPFVPGDKGAVYTIVATLKEVLITERLFPRSRIGVFGVGYLGWRVLGRLQELGYTNLVGVDRRYRSTYQRRSTIFTNDPRALSNCEVVIVVTSRGSDVAEVLPIIREGVRIIDDTHPEIPSELRQEVRATKGGVLYKAALGLSGVSFNPPFPGFHAQWIPGCVAEAMVVAVQGEASSQDRFEDMAAHIGLRFIDTGYE